MKWLAAAFSLFIVGLIVLADARLLGPLRGFYGFAHGDKVGHFVLYGLLALFSNLALPRRPRADAWRPVLIVNLTLAALIGLEEWSQSRFPSRTMDVVDLAASYAGVMCFSLIALQVRRREPPGQTAADQGSSRR